MGSTFQVEFSNRGQWDIGTTSSPPSYAHFYDNLTTVYDYEYHDFYNNATYDITGFDVAQMINEGGTYVGFAAFWPQLFGKIVHGATGTGHITRPEVLSSLCTQMYNETWEDLTTVDDYTFNFTGQGWDTADSYPRGAGDWSDKPMAFKNGILLSEVHYDWDSDDDQIKFHTKPRATDVITVVYKHQIPDTTTKPGESASGGPDNMQWHIDEPKTPYVIGEWCFDLMDEDYKRQFRAVTVYGLTDRHDAQDKDAYTDRATATWATVNDNVIDCEVQYYLNETFNPYDLYSAVEKQTDRYVYIETLDAATSSIQLVDGIDHGLWEFYSETGAITEYSYD